MIVDAFGTELSVGDVVVQDRRKMTTLLREVVEIDEDNPHQVRLGRAKSYLTREYDIRPTWVEVRKLTKYFDQGVFDV